MRGVRVCAVALGIAAAACATGSDESPDPGTTGEVEAGDAADLPGHDASHDVNGHDGASDTDTGAGSSDDGGSIDDATVPDDSNPPNGDDASDDVTVPGSDASDASHAID